MDIAEKLNTFFSKVNNNKIINLEKEKFDSEILEISNERIKNKLDRFSNLTYSIDQTYFDFIRITNTSICWTYTNERNEFIYGGFQLQGIIESLIQESDFWVPFSLMNDYTLDDNELEFVKRLNWFEQQSWSDDGRFGTFLVEEGRFPPRIYFFDNCIFMKMDLSLEEYFDAMIASCAVRGWQYFYVDFPKVFPNKDRINKKLVLKQLELSVRILPKLFTDCDFSFHLNRFDQIKNM